MKGYDNKKYPGVFTRTAQDGKTSFYILYRKPPSRRLIFEKASLSGVTMTAAKANALRSERMAGGDSNVERRDKERKARCKPPFVSAFQN